jgi:hypothetical protein
MYGYLGDENYPHLRSCMYIRQVQLIMRPPRPAHAGFHACVWWAYLIAACAYDNPKMHKRAILVTIFMEVGLIFLEASTW